MIRTLITALLIPTAFLVGAESPKWKGLYQDTPEFRVEDIKDRPESNMEQIAEQLGVLINQVPATKEGITIEWIPQKDNRGVFRVTGWHSEYKKGLEL